MTEGRFSESRISLSTSSSDSIFAESSWSTICCVSHNGPMVQGNLIPWPSFSRAACEVENAANLGVDIALHVCCSNEVRRKGEIVDSVLGWHCAVTLGIDRGIAREKLRRDIMVGLCAM